MHVSHGEILTYARTLRRRTALLCALIVLWISTSNAVVFSTPDILLFPSIQGLTSHGLSAMTASAYCCTEIFPRYSQRTLHSVNASHQGNQPRRVTSRSLQHLLTFGLPTMSCLKVDRICTGREVTGNDIKVSAEPHLGEVRLRGTALVLNTVVEKRKNLPWHVKHPGPA